MGRVDKPELTSPRGVGTQGGRDWRWLSCRWWCNVWVRFALRSTLEEPGTNGLGHCKAGDGPALVSTRPHARAARVRVDRLPAGTVACPRDIRCISPAAP